MKDVLRLRLAYLIVALAGAMLVFTIASTSVYSMDASGFGLVSRLPIFFWVGLVLLCFLWYIGRRSRAILITALVLTLSFLFIAPAIIKVPVWLSNSYYPYAESLLIDSSGHLVDRPSTPLFSYHEWPLFLYLASILKITTGIPDVLLLKYFPLVTISLYGLLTLLVLKTKLRTEYAILGAAWFLGSYWLRQQYFGPQGIAYILFLLAFLLLTWIFFDERVEERKLSALFIFVFVVLTLTHVLTAFMCITLLVALYVSQRFVIKEVGSHVTELVGLSIVFFLFYNLFFAHDFFEFAVRRLYQGLLGITEYSFYSETSRVIGSSANRLNYLSSWGSVFVNAGIALTSLILISKKVFSRGQVSKEGYGVFCGFSLVFFVLYGITLQYGLHEAYQRAFMFGLVPLAYLCIDVLKSKPKLLVGILAVLIFLNIPAQYGSDSFRLSTSQELAGSRFFATYSPQGSSCFDEFSLYVRFYNPTKNIRFEIMVASAPSAEIPNQTSVTETLNKVDYIIQSQLQDNYYYYYLASNPLNLFNFDRFNKVYDNGGFSIFSNTSKTLG